MPSSIRNVFAVAGAAVGGTNAWGDPPAVDGPGVYVISLTNDIDRTDATLPIAPVSWGRINTLLARRPELELDGERPSPRALQVRIGGFWLPDETVLYIGMSALSVRKRLNAFYRTELGAKRPHAGGWFLKVLSLDDLFLHYAPSFNPEQDERHMLTGFAERVSSRAREHLFDPDRIMPFANLEHPKGARKRHGISHATGPLGPNPPTVGPFDDPLPARPNAGTAPIKSAAQKVAGMLAAREPQQPLWTHPVTAADLQAGRIRISSETSKGVFPTERCEIDIELLGRRVSVRWNPRLGPDRERSGVISMPPALLASLVPGQTRLQIQPVSGRAFRLLHEPV